MAVSYQSFIDQIKEKHNLPDDFSEEELYEYGKIRYPGVSVDVSDKPIVAEGGNDPSTLAHLLRYGVDEDSWEWAKQGYANSLQGTTEKYMEGKLPFEMKKEWEDLGIPEQALSMILSFTMPMDVLSLLGGGVVGKGMAAGLKYQGKKLVQKGMTDLGKQGIKRRITEAGNKYGIKNGGQLIDDMLTAGVKESQSLGIYEAAKAGIEAKYQNKYNPAYKDNPINVMSEIGAGYAHGMFTGGVLGLTGGFMGSKFARIKKAQSRYPNTLKSLAGEKNLEGALRFYGKSGRWSTDPVGAATLTGITAGTRVWDGEFQWEDMARDFAVNSAFMAGNKYKHKAIDKTWKGIGEKTGLKAWFDKNNNEYKDEFEKRKDKLETESEFEDTIINEFNKKANDAENAGDTKQANTYRNVAEEFKSKKFQRLKEDIKNIQEREHFQERWDALTKWYEANKELLEDIGDKTIDKFSKRAEQLIEVANEQQVLFAELDAIITKDIAAGKYDKMDASGQIKKDYGFTLSELKSVRDEITKISQKLEFEKGERTESKVRDHQWYSDKILLNKDLMKTFGLESKDLADMPIERLKEIWNRHKESVDEQVIIAAKIAAAQQGKGLVVNKKSKDLDIKQTEYDTSLQELKDIKTGKDESSPAWKIIKDLFTKGFKRKKGEPKELYLDGVSEFNLVALKEYLQSQSKQVISKSEHVAKFLNYLGKLNKDIDAVTFADLLNYVSRRRVQNNGKPLGSPEMSALSTFAKFISDPVAGKFNKKISFIGKESIFEATNKRLKAGTEPSVEGIRKEVIEIGQKLSKERSKEKNSEGYSLVADLMARLGIRDIEVSKITKKELKRDSKGRDYIDLEPSEIITDPGTGRIEKSIGTGKSDTIRRYVYVPKGLANKLNKFFEAGGKLEKKHYSTVGKKITKSKNKQRKQLDLRSRIESDALIKNPDIMEQLSYVLGHDVSRIGSVYRKMSPEQAINLQEALHKRKILGVKGVKAKSKPPKIVKDPTEEPPTPHESQQEKALRKLDEGQKKHKRLYEEEKDPKQKKIADEKDTIKTALKGGWGVRKEAEMLLKKYIKIHKAYAKRLKTDKEFAKKKGVGNAEYHETWVKDYKEMLDLLRKGDTRDLQHKLSDYDNISNTIKRRAAILRDAHILQRNVGIGKGKKQLSKEEYKKRLSQDIKDSLGEKDITSLTKLTTSDMIQYMNHIQEATNPKNSHIKESLKSMFTRAEKAADEAQLISSERADILKVINPMTEGRFDSKHMNRETMKEYRAVVEAMANNMGKSQTWSERAMVMVGETALKFPNAIFRGVIPAYSLLKRYGGKEGNKIANTLLDYDVVHSLHRGRVSQAMHEIKQLEKKFEVGDRHMLRFRSSTLRKELTSTEKKFIENMNKPKTPENKALKIIEKTYDTYWKLLPVAIRKYGGRANVEKIEEYLGRLYLEDYMTHRVNPVLLPILSSLSELAKQPFWKKKFNEEMDRHAKRIARKEGLSKGEDAMKYEMRIKDIKIDPEHQTKVKSDVVSFFGKAMNRLDNPNFRKRGVELDRFTEIISPTTGRKIKVRSYSETLEGGFEAYGVGMSKYLATIRFFPEFTTIGRKFGLPNVRSDMFDMMTRKGNVEINKNWYDYTSELIQNHLGFDSPNQKAWNNVTKRRIGKFTTSSAAAGLFTPTAGLKNIFIGTVQTASKFGVFNTFNSATQFFDAQDRLTARRKGWTQYGTKENVFEAQETYFQEVPILGKKLTMDKLFIFMSKSEEFNRFVAGKAGELYFAEVLSSLKGNKGITAMSKKSATREMEDVFKFSKEEIKHMKDNSYDYLYSKENEGNMNWIINKAGHYAHVTTQGGTSAALLPLWMSRGNAKPFTLFYRIAASMTHNTYNSFVKPIVKDGNIMPMVKFAALSGLSGAAMHSFYDLVLGKEEPLSQSDKNIIFTKMLPYLWRAEFFGLFGELFNPYNNWINMYGDGLKIKTQALAETSMFEPVILRNSKLLLNQTFKFLGGGAEVGKDILGMDNASSEKGMMEMWQAINKTLTEGVVIGGQVNKIWKNRDKNYETHQRLRTMSRQFLNEKGYSKPSIYVESERSPFYQQMKADFWSGSEKDWAKTYWAAHAYIVSELERDGNRNPAARNKLAKRFIESSLKSFDPLSISNESKNRVMSKRDEFLRYLDKDTAIKAKELSRTYNSRLGYLLRISKKYKRKYSTMPY